MGYCTTIAFSQEEIKKCKQFAKDCASQTMPTRAGGQYVRNLTEIERDIFRGKLGEVAMKNFIKQSYDVDVELDFEIYPLEQGDETDVILYGQQIQVKAIKEQSRWLLVEKQDVDAGKTHDVYVLIQVSNDFTWAIINGYVYKDAILNAETLWKGTHIPGTTTRLDASNYGIHVKDLLTDWDALVQYNEYKIPEHPFSSTPRQVGRKRELALDKREFEEIFNKFNGIHDKLYYSIYRPNTYDSYEKVILDSVFFDMDSENCLENTRKMLKYCRKHNYRALFVFSTRGFWVFIKTTAVPLKHPKNALEKAQRHIAKEVGLTVGNSKNADVDSSSIGDIQRITRAIGSRDCTRNRFCMLLKQEEIEKLTYEEIVTLSETYRPEYYMSGDALFDMTPFDVPDVFRSGHGNSEVERVDLPDGEAVETTEEQFNTLFWLPCVKRWLTVPYNDIYKARYFYAVYCKNEVIPMQVCDAYAKKYFSKTERNDRLRTNYRHWRIDRTMEKAYERGQVFPTCNSLMNKGLCREKCRYYKGDESPLYLTKEEL